MLALLKVLRDDESSLSGLTHRILSAVSPRVKLRGIMQRLNSVEEHRHSIHKGADAQSTTIGSHADRSLLARGHHFRAARAPALDDFFVRMTER